MKSFGSFCIVVFGSTLVLGQDADVGTGPYPAAYFTEEDFGNHTFYSPVDPPADQPLQIFLWGEGGCFSDGLQEVNMLTEVASHGFLVIASGAPGGNGSTTSASLLVDALDYIDVNAGTDGPFSTVDTSKIAVGGYSCGGLEAYEVSGDDRVDIIGIFDSGFLGNNSEEAAAITKPVFYFLGGETDIAYANGLADYGNLTAGIPKWLGNLDVGHGGTYADPHGGLFGKAAVQWLQWAFKANETAAEYFTAGGAEADGWYGVESADLDKFLSYTQ